MRSIILIVVLLAVAGGLFFLIMEQEPVEPSDPLDFEVPGETAPDEEAEAMRAIDRKIAEVVPDADWTSVSGTDELPHTVEDPRFARRVYKREDGEGPWRPTGAEVLEVLTRRSRADLVIKFQDQATLDDFKKARWPIEVPSEGPIHVLLDTAATAGFLPVVRTDGIYIIRRPTEGP